MVQPVLLLGVWACCLAAALAETCSSHAAGDSLLQSHLQPAPTPEGACLCQQKFTDSGFPEARGAEMCSLVQDCAENEGRDCAVCLHEVAYKRCYDTHKDKPVE